MLWLFKKLIFCYLSGIEIYSPCKSFRMNNDRSGASCLVKAATCRRGMAPQLLRDRNSTLRALGPRSVCLLVWLFICTLCNKVINVKIPQQLHSRFPVPLSPPNPVSSLQHLRAWVYLSRSFSKGWCKDGYIHMYSILQDEFFFFFHKWHRIAHIILIFYLTPCLGDRLRYALEIVWDRLNWRQQVQPRVEASPLPSFPTAAPIPAAYTAGSLKGNVIQPAFLFCLLPCVRSCAFILSEDQNCP